MEISKYEEEKVNNLYYTKRELEIYLAKFSEMAETALLQNEDIEETLEYIGIKSDELLQKIE